MDSAAKHTGGKTLLNALAGVEAGVLGGLLMLVWLAAMAPLLGKPWWLMLNLFASTLYGQVLGKGPSWVTVVGSAVHLLICGIIGLTNGLLTPGGRLFGLAVAGSWYLLCYLLLWKRLAPLLLIYGSQPLFISGYFLVGSALGQHTELRNRLSRADADAA